MIRPIIILLLFWTNTLSFAQGWIRECGGTYYSSIYKPIEINSFGQMPTNIQDSVTKHLRGYLGDKFYNLLSFKSGIIINYKDLINVDSNVNNYKWQVPTYDLSFYITAKISGIDFCCSRIQIDSLGNVLDEIDFPKTQPDEISTKFVQKKIILKKAKRHGFDANQYQIDFSNNQIVIKFSKAKGIYHKYIVVSVNTGKVLRKYSEIWEPM